MRGDSVLLVRFQLPVVRRVFPKPPGHSLRDQLQVDVLPFDEHTRDGSTIPILIWWLDDTVFPKTRRDVACFARRPKAYPLSGQLIPCSLTLTSRPSRKTLIVSPSATPTARPEKRSPAFAERTNARARSKEQHRIHAWKRGRLIRVLRHELEGAYAARYLMGSHREVGFQEDLHYNPSRRIGLHFQSTETVAQILAPHIRRIRRHTSS
jgi:hypothetical protein